MGTKCYKCKTKIENREFLNCGTCSNSFHVNCTTVSIKRFYNTMKPSSKANWKCDTCSRNPQKVQKITTNNETSVSTDGKQKKSTTPPSPHLAVYSNAVGDTTLEQTHQLSDIPSSDETQTTSTPLPSNQKITENITYRKKYEIINIHTSNSFESLISDDELFEDIEGSTVQNVNSLNRSCPNLQLEKEDDTKQKLKQRNDELENRILISDKLYNELLLENDDLRKKISEQETKINRLTTICTSTTKKKQQVKQQKINKKKLKFSKETFSGTASNIYNNENVTTGQAGIDEDAHVMDKTVLTTENVDTPKICILSSNKNNKIMTTAQRIFSDEFSIIHYLKPGGGTVNLVNEIDKHLTGFTKRDFCIVFISEEDFKKTNDYFVLISSLREKLQKITYTNIVVVLPTYKYGIGFNIYNWRIGTFNNLLWHDNEIHGYAYIHDSNLKLKYDYSMFKKYSGTLNNYGYNSIFKDLDELMTGISSSCSLELIAKNVLEVTKNSGSTANHNDSVLNSFDNNFFRV